MTIVVKLVLSVAVLCFATGYAARKRNTWWHKRLMGVSVALAFLAPLLFLLGNTLELEPPVIAFWLYAGGASGGDPSWVIGVHRVAAGLLGVLLPVQVVLGLRGSRLHRYVPWGIVPLGVFSYSGMMLFYY